MSKSRLHIFEFKKVEPQRIFLASKHGMFTYSDLERYTAYFKHIVEQKAESLQWPVAFLSNSSDLLIFSIAACWKLGIPFVPISPQLTMAEVQSQLDEIKPALVLCDASNRTKIEGYETLHLDENFFLNAFTFDQKNANAVEENLISDDMIFGYFFTSGSTSKPKIVPLKRRQMLFAAKSSANNFKPDENHFWLLCLPLNHVGGISIVIRSLVYESAIYRMEEFHEEMVKEFLSENIRFQAASLVPTMLHRLLQDSLFKTHTGFKAILLGGGPVSQDLISTSAQRGIPIVSSYGMTETCAQIVANPLLKPSGTYAPLRSVGKPFFPNEFQIRDTKNGKKLGVNQSGVIWLRGPQVFDGYLDKRLNDEIFDSQGWFNTGDYGHMNGRGQLFIDMRRTDLIVSGGENVNPFEVENAFEKLNITEEVAVIGLPDAEWGQKVVAIVVPKTEQFPPLEDIRSKLKQQQLADYKIPKEIRMLKELPKTSTGKIKRWQLIEAG